MCYSFTSSSHQKHGIHCDLRSAVGIHSHQLKPSHWQLPLEARHPPKQKDHLESLFSKWSHITHLPKSLWWFPIVNRTKSKLLAMTITLFIPRPPPGPTTHHHIFHFPTTMGPLLSILKYTRPCPPLRISTPCSFCPKDSSTSSSQTGFLISGCLFTCIFSLLFQLAVKPHKDANGLTHTAPVSSRQWAPNEYLWNEWTCVIAVGSNPTTARQELGRKKNTPTRKSNGSFFASLSWKAIRKGVYLQSYKRNPHANMHFPAPHFIFTTQNKFLMTKYA